jgi:hypothetical protein
MKLNELKALVEPAEKELFVNLLSKEEQIAIQGYGSSIDEKTKEPYILLAFRKLDPKADEYISKWNNQYVKGILIKAEKRNVAYG